MGATTILLITHLLNSMTVLTKGYDSLKRKSLSEGKNHGNKTIKIIRIITFESLHTQTLFVVL